MHYFATKICTCLLQNGALGNMRLVHFRICATGLMMEFDVFCTKTSHSPFHEVTTGWHCRILTSHCDSGFCYVDPTACQTSMFKITALSFQWYFRFEKSVNWILLPFWAGYVYVRFALAICAMLHYHGELADFPCKSSVYMYLNMPCLEWLLHGCSNKLGCSDHLECSIVLPGDDFVELWIVSYKCGFLVAAHGFNYQDLFSLECCLSL